MCTTTRDHDIARAGTRHRAPAGASVAPNTDAQSCASRPAGRLLLEHRDAVHAAAFSPGGTLVIAGSNDNTARLWDATTGRPIGQRMTHPAGVSFLAISPDGRTVLTGCADGKARLWDTTSGRLVLRPEADRAGHQDAVGVVAFSPEGRSFITGGFDETARVWDTSTGRPVGPPLRHRGAVWAAAFSPDGRMVLTGGEDGKLRLREVATGQPLGPTFAHDGAIWSAAFSLHGRSVLTGSADKTARLRDIPSELPDDLGRVATWVEAITGLALDESGEMRVLDDARWLGRRRRGVRQGGPLVPDAGRRLVADRYLLYSTDSRTEGLVYASSQLHREGDGTGKKHFVPGREYTRFGLNRGPLESWHWASGERPNDDAVETYEKVYTNLRVHNRTMSSPAGQKSRSRWGNMEFDGDISKDSPGSDLIEQLLLDEGPGPVYLLAWGRGGRGWSVVR